MAAAQMGVQVEMQNLRFSHWVNVRWQIALGKRRFAGTG